MTTPLYIGMGPPYVVRFTIAATAEFDPVAAAAATAIAVLVTKPSEAEAEWVATVESSSADEIVLVHALAIEDLDERGIYRVWARFTLGSGGVLATQVGKLPFVLHRSEATP